MTIKEIQADALHRAQNGAINFNYNLIINGFLDKGIPESDIKPRENVLTYHAWQALGRQVRRGEHGVRITSFIPMTKKDDSGIARPIGKRPKSVTVFHISQTDPYRVD